MVSSSKRSLAPWNRVTSARMASAICCGGQIAAGAEQAGEAFLAVHFFLLVFGVENAIGDEDDGVAGLGGDAEFLVGDVGKHAQRKAFGSDGDRLAGAAEDGLHGAGVGDLQGLVLVVPEREEHGDVLRIELALLQSVVEQGEHCGGLGLLLRRRSA